MEMKTKLFWMFILRYLVLFCIIAFSFAVSPGGSAILTAIVATIVAVLFYHFVRILWKSHKKDTP